MPSSIVRESVYALALRLATAARLFTLPQLAKHPGLSSLSQPVKRASECLRPYAGDFEKTEGAYGEPFRFRLSSAARRRLQISDKAVNGRSEKSKHWLSIGDLFLALHFRGGVRLWQAEPLESAGFDCFMVYQSLPVLAEIQRSPLTTKQWQKKLEPRSVWLADREKRARAPWQPDGKSIRPLPLVIDLCGQQKDTIGLPDGWLYARTVEEVPTLLMRYKMKMEGKAN